ncbi:hypothetical protein C446_09653 [Halobiforma nitratireducens JCM 10879]|uniref:Uncharacterized protein n=1 Tax=Halobiforma nitratireducens JCM 10879 TaxID=1227454 RepID=M0M208_9EURY|nr:hypothetical protein C446_09653 [Halobiforma nitratireducens JCM 10879]
MRNEIDQGRPTAFEIEEDDGTTREVTFKHFAEEIQEIGLNEALSLLQFIHIPTELYELHRDNLGFLEEDEQEAVIEYYTRVRAYQNQLEPLELGHYAQLVDILEKTSREETPDFLPMLESRINDCARGAYEQLGSVHESGDRAMEVLDGNREKHESDERADPDKEKV